MSVDIQWDTLTGGVEGQQLAEQIRAFIHERFQQVPLPRFIRSVKVHSFDFGTIPPNIEVKDICDPHPDFYEDDEEDEDDAASTTSDGATTQNQQREMAGKPLERDRQDSSRKEDLKIKTGSVRPGTTHKLQTATAAKPDRSSDGDLSPGLLKSPQTTSIPGGTSNLTYFHLPFSPGLSGATTPLAVAGGQFHSPWPDIIHPAHASSQPGRSTHQPSGSISSVNHSSSDPNSRPTSQHLQDQATLHYVEQLDQDDSNNSNAAPLRDPNDLQVVSHVTYSGNMNLVLTAEILLDYPMTSFVGVPFQLHITGFTFDGVSLLAYAKRRLHFCFLSPEDAKAFLGPDDPESISNQSPRTAGGLLEEIRVESEIGQKENGKQVLKNVGKVEKFILEQVRRIFENEFVFPSFWTFLV